MTVTPAIPNSTIDAMGLLNHAILKPFGAAINRVKLKLNIAKFTSLERSEKLNITLHSGRTDSNDGHNNRVSGNGAIPYHFHHTLGPHLPCCRSMPQQATSIINPYTGREVNLGQPYVFQNRNYFSVNLVTRALTIWDTMGASLSLLPTLPPFFNAGGSFSACNRGESAGSTLSTLGERFSFTYPTLPAIGTLRNNTFFDAAGDRGGRLQLLCHTAQAELDPDRCYAYISLETLRTYMLSGGFFTGFAPNMPANVWSFTNSVPLAEITSPQHNEHFQVDETLIVRASLQDVREATLTINGRTIEAQTGLSGRNIVFGGYMLTDDDIGSLIVGVDARNGSGVAVNLPTVRVNVVAIPQPSVCIISPQNGTTFTVGDSIIVEIDVESATNSEFTIGDYRQTLEHSLERQRISFAPYTFVREDVGDVDIILTSRNDHNMTATDSLSVQVLRRVELLTTAYVGTLESNRISVPLTDLWTGKQLNISWQPVSNRHTDWSPMTSDDTAVLKSILAHDVEVDDESWENTSSWSWNARPGVIDVHGRLIAVGFHLFPHGSIVGGSPGWPFVNDSNTPPADRDPPLNNWPLGGHMCLYYGDSAGGTQAANDAAEEAYRMSN